MPKKLLLVLRDPKKCLGLTEVDFRQKLEISIIGSKKFDFFDFSPLTVKNLKKQFFKNRKAAYPGPPIGNHGFVKALRVH